MTKEEMRQIYENIDADTIDIDFCNQVGVNSEWFKFTKNLAECLDAIAEIGEVEGQVMLSKESEKAIAYTVLAMCWEFMGTGVPDWLESILKKNKMCKFAFNLAKQQIDDSRVKLAICRCNGFKNKPNSERGDQA